MKTFLKPIYAIARVTFQEIILDKVLYNFLLFAFLLIGVSYLASQLTFIGQDRVILDFGMSAINLSCGIIGVFQGAGMIGREYERRTMFVALARPISRLQFITGKFLGLIAVLFLNWLLLSGTELALYFSLSGAPNETILYGLAFLWIQACVLAAFAVFFSSFTTTSISVMMVIGIYLIGNNVDPLRQVLEKGKVEWVKTVALPLVSLIPNLSHFNLGFLVTYGLELPHGFVWRSVAYAIAWMVPLIVCAGRLLDRREG
ncbi:MAG: ABC transporter permease [Cryobacterium sp.]|nr:ABC transporter permease [Oligoflexia bacterium]